MANICQTCGDRGFEEALIYCDSYKIEIIHRYCLGITPIPFTEYIRWVCEECDGSDIESDGDGNDNDTDYDLDEEPDARDVGIGWRKSTRERKPNPKYMD